MLILEISIFFLWHRFTKSYWAVALCDIACETYFHSDLTIIIVVLCIVTQIYQTVELGYSWWNSLWHVFWQWFTKHHGYIGPCETVFTHIYQMLAYFCFLWHIIIKARGCSTKRFFWFVIHSFIHSFNNTFPHLSLQCHQAQTVRDTAPGHNIYYVTLL